MKEIFKKQIIYRLGSTRVNSSVKDANNYENLLFNEEDHEKNNSKTVE